MKQNAVISGLTALAIIIFAGPVQAEALPWQSGGQSTLVDASQRPNAGIFTTQGLNGEQVLTQAGRQVLANVQNQLPGGASSIVRQLPNGDQALTTAGNMLFNRIRGQIDLSKLGPVSPALTAVLDNGQRVLTTTGVQVLQGIELGNLDVSGIPGLDGVEIGSITSALGGGLTGITDAGAQVLDSLDLGTIPGIDRLPGLDLGLANLGSINIGGIPGLPPGLDLGSIDIGSIPGASVGKMLPGPIGSLAGGGGPVGALTGSFGGGGGIPVRDAAVGATTGRIAVTAQNQLAVMNQIRAIDDQTLAAVGQKGVMPLEQTFGEAWLPFADGGPLLKELNAAAPTNCELTVCADEGDGSAAFFATYRDAKNTVASTLFIGGNARESDRQVVNVNRKLAGRNSAINAYALSLLSRSYSSTQQDRAQQLEEMVNSADTVRKELKAQSAILLALYQAAAQQYALEAALGEAEALRGIQLDGNDYLRPSAIREDVLSRQGAGAGQGK